MVKGITVPISQFHKGMAAQIFSEVRKNPLPASEGGYGKPLGNRHGKNLTGLYKIKLLKEGICVVYALVWTEISMKVIVIAARADDEVYEIAEKRMNKLWRGAK